MKHFLWLIALAAVSLGSAQGQEVCLSPMACNFQSEGPCQFFNVWQAPCVDWGCSDESACNYSGELAIGDCIYPLSGYGCDGVCLADVNENGICDGLETSGCIVEQACNYNALATIDDGSCDFCHCGTGTVWDPVEGACVSELLCFGDLDNDGHRGSGDLLEFLGVYGEACPVEGCTNAAACNFNPEANVDDGSCTYCSCNGADDQGYGLELEAYQLHDAGELAGMTTWRFYALAPHADDFVSAVFGNMTTPLHLETENGFFNSEFATGATEAGVNPMFFAFTPELAFDSFVTIGLTSVAGDSESPTMLVESPFSPWSQVFNSSALTSGGNVYMSDAIGGAWFVPNGASNGVSGDDHRVLIIQLTTEGDFNGTINVQYFKHGLGAYDVIKTFQFANGEWVNMPINFELCGCTDNLALNFDATAIYLDESCYYWTAGCLDDAACNYNPFANEEDDSCVYQQAGYDCDGGCLDDADADGICDEFEVAGCTNALACNFDPDATDDDGSCNLEGGEPNAACNDGDPSTVGDQWDADGCLCEGMPAVGVNGPCLNQSAVSFSGESYALIEIGSQCWFLENLRAPKTASGAALSAADWTHPNGDADNQEAYGLLYSNSVIGSLCPAGWHIPTFTEAQVLFSELGGAYVAAGKMKAHELDVPAWDGTNESGFTLLPSGGVNGSGINSGFGSESLLWTSSSYGPVSLYRHVIGAASGTNATIEPTVNAGWQLPARCLKN